MFSLIEAQDIDGKNRVNRFYQQQGEKSRVGKDEYAFITLRKNEIIAALRLLTLDKTGQSDFWLRSLYVMPEARRQGAGLALLRSVLKTIYPQECYCFPLPHLNALYRHAGFVSCDELGLPGNLRTRYQRYIQKEPNLLAMKTGHQA